MLVELAGAAAKILGVALEGAVAFGVVFVLGERTRGPIVDALQIGKDLGPRDKSAKALFAGTSVGNKDLRLGKRDKPGFPDSSQIGQYLG